MEIKSGRRKFLRLELNKDIFKAFKLIGEHLEDGMIIDISHGGLGLYFPDVPHTITEGMELKFTLEFDENKIEIEGKAKHTGARLVGLEFFKFLNGKDLFHEYLDSRIIKKFHIPAKGGLHGLYSLRFDMKMTLLLMIIEAIVIIGLFYFFSSKNDCPSKKMIEANNSTYNCISS